MADPSLGALQALSLGTIAATLFCASLPIHEEMRMRRALRSCRRAASKSGLLWVLLKPVRGFDRRPSYASTLLTTARPLMRWLQIVGGEHVCRSRMILLGS